MRKILQYLKKLFYKIRYSQFFLTKSKNRYMKTHIIDIEVKYLDFNGNVMYGILQVNREVKDDVLHIFDELFNMRFPINSIIPIDAFGNSDEFSVIENNSSCFNYRYVKGTNKLSDHAKGLAIDINPIQNPWESPNALKKLKRKYNKKIKGTINDDVVLIFKKHGWKWGGNWKTKDYQHFYKKMD